MWEMFFYKVLDEHAPEDAPLLYLWGYLLYEGYLSNPSKNSSPIHDWGCFEHRER